MKDDVDLSRIVFAYILYHDNLPALHFVNVATRYQATRRLHNVNSDKIWGTLYMCWIECYIGPPDIVMCDERKLFKPQAFSQNSGNTGAPLKAIPVKDTHPMRIAERDHGPSVEHIKLYDWNFSPLLLK